MTGFCATCGKACLFNTCSRLCRLTWKKARKHLGDEVLRAAPTQIGPASTYKAPVCRCGDCVACEFRYARKGRRRAVAA